MSFTVYFLKTFPSPAWLDKLFNLFTDIGWELEAIKIKNEPLRDYLSLKEDAVVISPEVEEPFLLFNEGYANLYLPISTRSWNKAEELLKRRHKVYKTYTGGKLMDLPATVFVNERELSAISEREIKPPEGVEFFTDSDESLEGVVGKLLREKGLTIATAESCTGGLVAATLVNVSGSSEYFKGSVVAYSNEVKEKVLGVKRETLEKYGAVSERTAKEMAVGVRELLKTDIGISTTGIAGPTGGTEEKPVGLTYFGIAFKDNVYVFKEIFPFDRNQNRLSATYFALFQLWKLLKGEQ
jgi:nicotinamide-nucleotide amidase